jgi:hypothetical protein
VAEDFAKTFDAVRKGRRIPKLSPDEVGFTSIEAVRNFLTRERLALMRTIRTRHPDSLCELARMVERDLKNVQERYRDSGAAWPGAHIKGAAREAQSQSAAGSIRGNRTHDRDLNVRTILMIAIMMRAFHSRIADRDAQHRTLAFLARIQSAIVISVTFFARRPLMPKLQDPLASNWALLAFDASPHALLA